jgi:hypothetical protein
MKIPSLEAELFHTDGRTDRQTDVTQLIVDFCNFAKTPINLKSCGKQANIYTGADKHRRLPNRRERWQHQLPEHFISVQCKNRTAVFWGMGWGWLSPLCMGWPSLVFAVRNVRRVVLPKRRDHYPSTTVLDEGSLTLSRNRWTLMIGVCTVGLNSLQQKFQYHLLLHENTWWPQKKVFST